MQDVASRVPDLAAPLGVVAESLLSGQSLVDSSPVAASSAAQLHSACSDIVNRVKSLHNTFCIVRSTSLRGPLPFPPRPPVLLQR